MRVFLPQYSLSFGIFFILIEIFLAYVFPAWFPRNLSVEKARTKNFVVKVFVVIRRF